jgi:hypothetical protein
MGKGKLFGKVILSGVLFAVVAWIIHMLGALLSMGYYKMPEYASLWSKIMMPTAGASPPLSFSLLSLLFGFIGGVLFAIVYDVLMGSVPGKKTNKGLAFGFLIFLVAGIPGYLSLLLLINIPAGLAGMWLLENLVVYLLGGMIVAGIIRSNKEATARKE